MSSRWRWRQPSCGEEVAVVVVEGAYERAFRGGTRLGILEEVAPQINFDLWSARAGLHSTIL